MRSRRGWRWRRRCPRCRTCTLVGECQNGFDAVKVVTEVQPDVVLLDVQMPKLDGFEVLELIGADVPVVFVTAYDEFAIRAFEVHAVDYLLKPVSPERLRDGAGPRARTRPAGDADAGRRCGPARGGRGSRSSAW